jgi:hypothetical protein
MTVGHSLQTQKKSETENEKLVVSIDSQVLAAIQTCNQQAKYRFIDSIEPQDYESDSIDIGLVMHEGLAEHYEQLHKVPANVLRNRVIARMEAYAGAKTTMTGSQSTR